ncbi:unnamed protein product [Tilletia laevis]|uniref:Tubulin-specific chaperone D n=1 Tax=Tilletia laevis TaxID=157183 RepID=A0A9N8LP36_9BASI|nr:unnamed protein product [Tilletia caries]CAD6911097.1 unnamed protein product [Tilletia laevis]CAD6926604.1 unnamed protein product [Tilletia controversa]CAD6953924.1 unnamed protein product [Tilletia laevis]
MSAAEAAQLVQARAPGSNGAPDHAAGPADELGGLAAEAAATVEERELASFEQIDEFRTLLADFLAATAPPGSEPGAKEGEVRSAVKRGVLAQPPNPYQNPLIAKLLAILSPYQEQPYLLDPYLDELVVAPVQALQRIIRGSTDVGPVSLDSLYAPQLQELAVLIYSYTKIRGDKVITRFFPHEVDDLLPVVVSLELLSSADASESTPSTLKPVGKGPSAAAAPTAAVWELRYVLLLWLSLVCMIPFDLRQLDQVAQEQDGSVLSVAGRIEKLGRRFLASPGKERDAAAMMMGKLFQRRDLKDEALARFLEWSQQSARADEASSFLQTGIMQALCEIIKVSDPGSIETHLPALLDLFDSSESASGGSDAASQNVLVLRYEAKMACRLGLKLLKPRKTRRTKTAKSLDANLKTTATGLTDQTASAADAVADEDEDEDIPEQVDQFVSKLLTCLESKDTTVRYSAAKGIARLCERLPPSFVSQLTDAIRSLFAINVIERDAAGGGGEPDLSNASEHTWQGACMAIAELARRGLLVPEELDETMRWILRALTFDVRRGANSVGSAVRDAACYVLWALARAHTNAEALRSHAQSMAAQLLVVATLDREVSIRRAASAAFQECVGRMGNIPHGIDVLRKTDFYAVGVRRNAFVSCAPEVAAHDVYRPPLLHHLLTVTISHWDRSMRTLAAESIRALVDIDFERQAEYVALKLAESVKRHDAFTVHGSLLALSQLAELCEKHVGSAVASNVLRTCLDALHRAPLSVLRSTGAAWPLYAACELIRTTSTTCLTVNQASISVPTDTLVKWNDVLDQALARQEEYVHEALVTAHGALSRVQDPTTRVQRVLQGWKSLHPTRQQSNALLLGFTNFTNRSGLFEETIRFLLSLLDSKDRLHSTVIEVRRNTVRSIDQAIRGLRQELPSTLSPETSEKTLETLLACLEDYTIDQRGDVGSWVRIASLTSLRHFTEEHVRHVSEPELSRRITKEQFDRILAGVLKQCVERIDAVREHAGAQLVAIRACSLPLPKMEGADLLAAALPEGEEVKFQDAGWAFPRIINLLEVPVYRVPILRGIATSIASKSDMAQRIVGTSLVDWANAQPDRFGVLLRELHGLAVANFGANSTFVPVVSTMTLLIEGGAADELDGAQGDELTRKLGRLCTQNVDKIKSMARVQASAALCVNLLRISTARSRSLDALPLFLLHSFTAIRTSTAEQLYIVLQDIVEDEIPEEAEEILLNTKWAHRVQNVQTAKLQEVLRANLLLE